MKVLFSHRFQYGKQKFPFWKAFPFIENIKSFTIKLKILTFFDINDESIFFTKIFDPTVFNEFINFEMS